MDESGFHFEHQPVKVVCRKGTKSLNSRVSSSRENVTIIACTSASEDEKEEKERKDKEKDERMKARAEKKRQQVTAAASKSAPKTKKQKLSSSGTVTQTRRRTPAATRTTYTTDKCTLCFASSGGDWVQCDTCQRWMHQKCVPPPHQRLMKYSIESGEPFRCHICMFFNGYLSFLGSLLDTRAAFKFN
ncbi:hypothetical protein ElyMa_000122000 [Elysia marginata]|uniref:PHD-type domain-containing protein n=1 Tax=Elysia marginata TaxID=1093978 RepID=A0AAV4EMZ5_9GAST|nr:hypothetical protein ElyMa_000122000 [Elysia marginata]